MHLFIRAGICALIMVAGLVSAARAQLILNRQVTATTGASGTAPGNVRIQYTIGEPVVTFIQDSRVLLTQGFQQPEELPAAKPGEDAVISYLIYPNPAATTLKIQMDLKATKDVQFTLINTAGQMVYTTQQTLGAGKNVLTIAVNKFAAGIYTVKIKVGLQIFWEKVIIQ